MKVRVYPRGKGPFVCIVGLISFSVMAASVILTPRYGAMSIIVSGTIGAILTVGLGILWYVWTEYDASKVVARNHIRLTQEEWERVRVSLDYALGTVYVLHGSDYDRKTEFHIDFDRDEDRVLFLIGL
ncbi:MAG: hypothetical protein EOO77_34935 [Oxalobacteraceae bacterium]|nr:MAG: hypothetical protein EOO77_34935 [Oxalobacteraceae bacterium]